jgi:Na+/melibiose symporter-like transporter
MSDSSQKLSFREKAGYSLGDAATNFFFQAMIMYQQAFYTDVMGVAASTIGWVFLLVRLFDGVVDPVVGILADRTDTRIGKFRPWVLWTAVPFGLILWAAYTVPGLGGTATVVYAAISYTLLMVVYSANNTPYSALSGVMTGDVSERTSIAQYRFVAAMVATFAVQGFTLPLVAKLGAGNKALGFSMTFAIFGGLAVMFYIIAGLCAKERIRPNPQQKSSIKEDFKAVFRCKPWVAMFAITLFVFTTLALRGGGMYNYFTYYVDKPALLEWVNGIGLGSLGAADGGWFKTMLGYFGFIMNTPPEGVAAAGYIPSNLTDVGLSVFNMAGNVVTIIGVLFSKALAERFGKKTVFVAGLGLTTLITAAIFFVPASSIGTLFLLSLAWPAAYGPTIPLLWAMIADVADYSEWQTGRRATGFVYAGIVFALKAGLGLGGAIGGWLLASYHYVPNAVQTAEASQGIRVIATLWSALPFGLGVLALAFYPITKRLNIQIQDELAARRAKFQQS